MGALSFLSPLFLAGAAAVAIPIALHLFYRRTDPVIHFAAMRYLRQAPVEQSRRRRLREVALLALRVAALTLLAVAFARPYLDGAAGASSGPATIVLVDTSASLSAPGVFERVRERAAQVIRDAPPTHAVGVVSFSQSADVSAPLSRDRAGALAAISQLVAGAGATRYRTALERAAEEYGGRPGRLVVVTDMQESGWDAAGEGGIPGNLAVDVETIDGAETNLAIASLRIDAAEAVATVQNFSRRAVTNQVVFAVDGRRLGAVPLLIAAGGAAEARLSLAQAGSGALSASITDREGYRADNVRYAVLDAGHAMSVLAVTATGHPSEALYLERSLTLVDGVGGFGFASISGAAFSGLGADVLDRVDVIAVMGTRGLDRRGRERLRAFVESGGGLLVTAGPDVEPAVVAQALEGLVSASWRPRPEAALRFAPADGRHPVFRLFNGVGTLGNVTFARAALVNAGRGQVIARYSDGTPALVDEHTTRGRVLTFGSDVNARWNDFPLQPAFVPFIYESLRYLASPRSVRAEYLVGDLPGLAGSTPGVMAISGGPDKVRPARAARMRHVAVNVDPRESDPRRMDADAFRAGIARFKATATQQASVAAVRREDDQGLWRYGLVLMFISLAAEGFLGRRFQ